MKNFDGKNDDGKNDDDHEMNEFVLSERDSEWFLKQLETQRSPNVKLRQALESLDD